MFYKVLGDDQSSHHGGSGGWVKNRWRTVEGEIVPCENGIHYCNKDQLIRWIGPSIWIFEDGSPEETVDASDKLVTRKGRVTERLETWNETTARLFAADVAEVALQFIREQDRDPFVAAINAARGFARGEISDKGRSAAWSAAWSAAESAARSAAWSAAWSAAKSTQTVILFDYLEGRRT